MTKDKPELMLHPFSGVPCEVVRLQPGAVIEDGDVYRSATIAEDGSPISAEVPAPGKWYAVTPTIMGSSVAVDCNVHFIRLRPTVTDA